jgi:glutamate-1-semialdehyde 2,1-aminomutase
MNATAVVDLKAQEQPPRSEAQADLVKRAKAVFPGGTGHLPKGKEFLIERGEGPYLFDGDGRRFLDVVMGGGPLALGHAHPRIVETIRRTAPLGTTHAAMTRRAVELAERLVKYVPSAEMVRFASTGSETTFHAIRLARAVTGRNAFIKFDGGYHGHHDLACFSVEAKSTKQPLYELPKGTPVSAGIQKGVADDIYVLPWNDAAAVRDALGKDPTKFAAIICEPMQRNLRAEPGFLETLRAECDRTGTILIFDELVTGFRFAPATAQERYGVTPDLTCLGKALSCGLPFAAIVGRRKVMEHLDPASPRETYSHQAGTLNGFLLGVECAHTALDVLVEEGGAKKLEQLGEAVRDEVAKALRDTNSTFFMTGDGPLFHPYFIDRPVRNNADIRAADWKFSDELHVKLLDAGVWKQSYKGTVSLAHDESHIKELGDAYRWAMTKVRQS